MLAIESDVRQRDMLHLQLTPTLTHQPWPEPRVATRSGKWDCDPVLMHLCNEVCGVSVRDTGADVLKLKDH